MKIRPICNTGFKSVVKFNTETNFVYGYSPKVYKTVDFSTNEVVNALNSKNTKNYNKFQAQNIRDFFARNIDDYDGASEIQTRRYNDNLYLISGEDIKKVEEIEQDEKEKILSDNEVKSVNKTKKLYKKILNYLNSKINKNEGFYFSVEDKNVKQNKYTKNFLRLNSFYYYNYDNNKKVYVGDLLEI